MEDSEATVDSLFSLVDKGEYRLWILPDSSQIMMGLFRTPSSVNSFS